MKFRIFGLVAIAAFLALSQSRAATPTLTTLVNFNGTDGATPVAGLIADANGNLFGTTASGGASNYGTVFEIIKTSGGYASTPTTLVNFNGTNGATPVAGLIADANGNLFGTTNLGGAFGYGTVFKIAKTADGYANAPTTLVSFNGTDGQNPEAGLIADANGNLFGTTAAGGNSTNCAPGCGTVFEVAKTPSTPTGYASTPTILVSFNGTDGQNPEAGLIADANGNLFGTTSTGGNSTNCGGGSCGTVFEIIKTSSGYADTPTTLVSFNGTDGKYPAAGLIADANGNLFGTTTEGGEGGNSTNCGGGSCGTVFEIIKTSSGYASTPTTLVSFNGTDGYDPEASLIADANGNLFGTTVTGGANNDGTVFEIIKTSGGYASTPTTLVSFNFTDGAEPVANLIADTNGNLFGTTASGGAYINPDLGDGTVYEVTDSGFIVHATFAGTPGTPNCHGQSVSALAQQYGSLDAAAAALGYSSVQVLQNAIAEFCAG